ncbi:MAG: hypothetical protein R3335_09660, partial [Anaerolineales bacterium]|nr:hypothetical protein [Anaerolineales bacterium]
MTKRSLIPLLLSILIVSACSLFDDPSSGGPASEAFSPSASTTLSAGKHHFTEFSVPDGVHVALDGDVSIRVDGEVAIEGSLSGDCATFRLEAGGNLSLTGQINNACSDEQNSSEVRLVVEGMAVIGGESPPGPVIVSGGDITIADAEGENLDLTEVVSDVEEALAPASGTSRRGSPPRQGGSGATIGAPIQPGPGGSINIPFNQQGAAVTVAVSLTAQNGAPGADLQASPDCDASGNRGQPGGSVRLAAPNGSLTVNSGVTLKAGDGGKGGDCTARGDGADQQATAGPGGRGGSVLVGGRGLTMTGVTVVRGSGGAGGNATAAAGDAEGECGRGYNATATAGEGGHRGGAGYVIIEPNDVTGTPDVTGGNGGRGGNADAAAGDGSECHTCPGGTGGSGGDATATAGDGGNGATRSLSWNITGGHRKGDGGNATARAGDGKEGATCCDPNEQAGGGGAGGAATAAAGQPGSQGKNPGIAGMSGNSPAGIGGDGGTGTGSPNVITDGDGGAPGLACADPIITLIDDREDPLVCTTLLPGKQDILQPFMDITSVNIRLSQTGEYIFHTTFDRVEGELETAIVESDQDVFEVSLNFYDSSQGLVSEDPWAPNTIAQQAIYLTYNGFFDEFDTSMASVEGGGWVQTDQTVPFSLSGDTVTISVTQELVQPSSTFAAIAGSWGEISNVWICDETGFGEDGLPGAPLPTIASPSTTFPVPTPVLTSTPSII